MSYYAEYRQRKQDGIWEVLNRLVFILFVFVGIALVICLFLPLVQKQKELIRRREELIAQVATQKEMNDLLTRKQNWLKDPEYVEILARDGLDLMKPGETVFRLDAQDAATAAPVMKAQPRQR